MDDLNSLDWSSSSNTTINKAPVTGSGNYYASLRPTPAPASSGRSTPLSAQALGAFKPPATGIPKSSTSDSFSNLVSFGSAKQGNKLTLQEQQEKLEAEKARKAAEQRKQYEIQFGHSQFWDRLSAKPQTISSTPLATSGTSTPVTNSIAPIPESFSETINGRNESNNDEDNDLLAAFNADTKVDNSSYYPPPNKTGNDTALPIESKGLDLSRPEAWGKPTTDTALGSLGDEGDPFGLGQMEKRTRTPNHDFAPAGDDEDFLGDLGKPVEEVIRYAKTSPSATEQRASEGPENETDDPWDKAVNELVDMGFSAENSRRALTESGAGLDVQAAVGWLLNDAHRQAKQKAQSARGSAKNLERENRSSFTGDDWDIPVDKSSKVAMPAWVRQEARSQSQSRGDDSRSLANNDNDISKTAAAVGSNLLKTANSLWKKSQKKVQKAVSEFAQDSDPSQPKWMRDASTDRRPKEKQDFTEDVPRGRKESGTLNVTDEALMLEADSRPPPRKMKGTADPRFLSSGSSSSRDQSPAASNPSTGRSTPVPRWQQVTPAPSLDQRSRLSKQTVEEQSAQAYVSPARRKKPAPPPRPTDTADLLFDAGSGPSQPAARGEAPRPQTVKETELSKPSKISTPIQVRPKAQLRNIPILSPTALVTSTQHRQAGTAHFKRGDYASAHASYTSSLSSIPQGHPISIILFSNRSLTALKTGDPKGAVSDADTALTLIGPSRGADESIDLGDGTAEAKKPMQEYWGKALMRKAEALEQMERWNDANAVWREAVEAGVGGATAVQGRQRCEKALAPKPKQSAARQPLRAPSKPKSALNDLALTPAQSTAAVNRLRAANLAAEKTDEEKFALSDSVDARISKWRDGRKDNLRALLGGLDQVLWEGSGWKKVGMHELVVNSKVKLVYMKAIARVHPDKVRLSFHRHFLPNSNFCNLTSPEVKDILTYG